MNVIIGSQQIHRRIIGVGITGAAILLNGALKLHPALMLFVAPQASVEMLDKQLEAVEQAAVIRKGFRDRFAVAYHTGLNAFCQPGAAQSGTAHFFTYSVQSWQLTSCGLYLKVLIYMGSSFRA